MTGVEGPSDPPGDPSATPGEPSGGPLLSRGLGRVAAFVNTADIETGQDELATAPGLQAWLRASGLAAIESPLGEEDARRVRGIREAIRDVLAGNAGHGTAASSLARLAEEGMAAPIGLSVSADGSLGLRPLATGLDGALATIFGDIITAVADGTWARLKVCRSDTCQYAFIDESRNGSRQWCSMAVCGNRMKGRAYRRRAKAAASGD